MQRTSLVLTGGRLLNAPQEGADSIWIERGRIARVGPRVQIERSAPGDAERIELGGRWVSPGFHDAHFHFLQTGIKASRPSLHECRSLEELLEAAREASRALPEREALVFEAWDESGWRVRTRPTRRDLDRLGERRPLILRRACDHVAVANSAGVAAIRNVWGDSGVEPESGRLTEGPVLHLEETFPPPREEVEPAFEAVGELCLSLGITTTSDFLRPGACHSYREYLERSELPVRVNAFALDECLDTPDLLESLPRTDRFRLRGIKIFADGSIGARTAALSEPYADQPHNRGELQHELQDLTRSIRRAHEREWTVAVHAIGDRAIQQVLDAFATLPSDEIPARGHRIEHLEMPRLESIDRLVELGIRPCVQPNFVGQWGGPGGLYEQALGAERVRTMNPFRTLLSRDTGVFFGSDGMPPSPLYGIRCAVRHPVAEERLSFEDAHSLYTEAPARALALEEGEGRIEPGARADLVVLSAGENSGADPLGADVEFTIREGEIVYRRGSP